MITTELPPDDRPGPLRRVRRFLVGAPRDLADSKLFHRLALIPFLAWVGLGADGLSSSAYGPEEAYRALGDFPFLAIPLAALMATTVLLISACYSRIIEEFPTGGGGYVVASKLLGPRAGLVSGSALLVDYVLTITISVAAAGDAIFSFLPPAWAVAKLGVEIGAILFLTILNIRGVRESVVTMLPIFLVFLVTHALLIGGGILGHLPELAATGSRVASGWREGMSSLGAVGLILLFLRAYSLGGGTYTGIEAVSNGLAIMREPKAATGRRTMLYMATSLAVTASGLLLCYLLWQVTPVPGKTMNAVLVGQLTEGLPFGTTFAIITLVSEGLLLIVAAQAGFLDGPRVLANMAIDSWVPHRFASLSERLTTQNGILVMGAAALVALLYSGGRVSLLVVMYSINVFVTFSLSMFAMLKLWLSRRRTDPLWLRRTALFAAGFALCATILAVTVVEKFTEGGWVTLLVTGVVIGICFLIHRHYDRARRTLAQLYRELGDLPLAPVGGGPPPVLEPKGPTAVILVNDYGGVGIHTVLNVLRAFPGFHRNLVFVAVGVIDSGEFKGEHAVDDLRRRTEEMLAKFVALAHSLGVAAESRYAIGTEVVEEAERLCLQVGRAFPGATFFAGKMIFQRERWWQGLLHNKTAEAVQQRLQWAGRTMMTMPLRVREPA